MGLEMIGVFRKEKGMTLDELSEKSGIPVSTIKKISAGITTDPNLSTVQAIAVALGCSIDDLSDTSQFAEVFSVLEKKMVKKYRFLDPYGKEAVDGVLDVEWRRCNNQARAAAQQDEQPKRPTVTLRRPFTQVAAAEGAGAFLQDSAYDVVTVELNSHTQKADIILKVVGQSMEPAIRNGDHILVREQPSVEVGEIGVFIVDGEGFLKQFALDRLVSLNPDISDVMIEDQQTAECYGKYICVLEPEWIVEE